MKKRRKQKKRTGRRMLLVLVIALVIVAAVIAWKQYEYGASTDFYNNLRGAVAGRVAL